MSAFVFIAQPVGCLDADVAPCATHMPGVPVHVNLWQGLRVVFGRQRGLMCHVYVRRLCQQR